MAQWTTQRLVPAKHRHDGTSPLPLGMDWCPPPRNWSGRDTVWPHDHRTGWSFCTTIPSWGILSKSKDSYPVVFYRVQVGIQSPGGVTTTRVVLRRFNDFLKLSSNLKRLFPKKNLPPIPPKGILRMKTRSLLEERRCSLEEWMTELLSDIDLSRCLTVATFLELEAAARTSFQDGDCKSSEACSYGNSNSLQTHHSSALSLGCESSSFASDYGSDTAYETSEVSTPRLDREESFEIGAENLKLDDLTLEKLVKYGISDIDNGLAMGQIILDQIDAFPKCKPSSSSMRKMSDTGKDTSVAFKASIAAINGVEHFSDRGTCGAAGTSHVRGSSSESLGSDNSSLRACEVSDSRIHNSCASESVDRTSGIESFSAVQSCDGAALLMDGSRLVLPLDQHHKLNRVLSMMQQRLVTAKIDMDDLISRLNQETAVKHYLTTKINDLEEELKNTKEKNKETFDHAILMERERVTQLQWDMEELRRKSLEMEFRLKSKEALGDKKLVTELKVEPKCQFEEEEALGELDTMKQLENLSRKHREMEAKSKAEMKFLVKEFKLLKNLHVELQRKLDESLLEKNELEKLLYDERKTIEHYKDSQKRLLHDCKTISNHLQEHDFNVRDNDDDDDDHVSFNTLISEDKIDILLVEAQELLGDKKDVSDNCTECGGDEELREVIASIFAANANWHKQVISFVRHAIPITTPSNAIIDDHVEKEP